MGLTWRTLGTAILLTTVFAVFMALIQFSSPDLLDNDGYYHIKLAYLMGIENLRPAFVWLPLTVLNPREFYDHHFLYHIALIPFTVGDLRIGAKVATVTFASLTFLSIWWLFRGQRVPYAALWSLGLLGISEAFIYRMSIPRAQSLSLLVLAFGLHWLLTGKYWRLLPLGFLYVWLYNAFPLLPVMAVIYSAAVLLVERRLELRPVFFSLAGITLGSIINPYFPQNLVFVYRHLLPKLVDTTAVSVGVEWYPYETLTLLQNSPMALLAFVLGGLALGLSNRRMSTGTATAFLLAVLTGLMLFQSRRFIEYFPAFALIFSAMAWSPLIPVLHAAAEKPVGDSPFPPSPGFMHTNSRAKIKRHLTGLGYLVPAIILAGLILIGIRLTYPSAVENMQGAKPYQFFAGSSAWLRENTPAGARIFQTDWDDFPRLFYYNHHNTYLVGLDPTYMQLYDAELYALWTRITQGKVDEPSRIINEQFGAEYVITDLQHQDFIREARQDPKMIEVYRDELSAVYRILP